MEVETGLQLMARLRQPPSIEDLAPDLFDKLKLKEVVEVCGDSGSGKTELAYHLVTKCILPSTWHDDVRLGGSNASVVYIDTEYRFDVAKLSTILRYEIEERVTKSGRRVADEDVTSLVRDCLKSVHLIRCDTNLQLNLTLRSLGEFLVTHRSVSLLVIDCISSQYWMERAVCFDDFRALDKRSSELVSLLDRVVNEYGLALIVTKQALAKAPSEGEVLSGANDYLNQSWKRLEKTRLFLSKVPGNPSASHTDIVVSRHLLGKTAEIRCRIDERGLRFL